MRAYACIYIYSVSSRGTVQSFSIGICCIYLLVSGSPLAVSSPLLVVQPSSRLVFDGFSGSLFTGPILQCASNSCPFSPCWVTSDRCSLPYKFVGDRSSPPGNVERICSSWNKGRCVFPGSCRFKHICATCRRKGHRAGECEDTPPDSPYKAGQQAPRTASPARIVPHPSRITGCAIVCCLDPSEDSSLSRLSPSHCYCVAIIKYELPVAAASSAAGSAHRPAHASRGHARHNYYTPCLPTRLRKVTAYCRVS